MKKSDIVRLILANGRQGPVNNSLVKAFAPTNIALCKYWGKRDQELNLPVTSSLSISLANKGAAVELSFIEKIQDSIVLNGEAVNLFSNFGKGLVTFLDLFRAERALHFHVNIQMNIPIAAGLASSACGFAALVLALNALFHWQLDARHLSILARLGSGSACRSIWPGFVEWDKGVEADGMDSYGKIIPEVWPELCIGLLLVSTKEKSISSRAAMQRTVDTSALYPAWPEKVNVDLAALKTAIQTKDFQLLGKTAESNALTMHSTMLSAWPPVSYFLPKTMAAMQKIWQLRQEGLSLYFTQDAGPNLKLLFLQQDKPLIQAYFPRLEVVQPFS
jgi:diphosphomevalonate decarboxylase